MEKAKKILNSYLSTHKLRRTPERYKILEYIYSRNRHFTIEDLQNWVEDEKLFISRTTLYNTIKLFLDCHLVVRHPIMNGACRYERMLCPQNIYKTVCLNCGEEKEFKDPVVAKTMNAKQLKRFLVQNHSVYLYGICEKCRRMQNKLKTID
ncbi:MAG: Fur family transcriptional regulator [Bacteroidales bacterium]|nr:Fur family transcriptional regulator [Bacteroidales bacterium]